MAVQLDYSIPRSAKIAANVPEPVDYSRLTDGVVGGMRSGVELAGMIDKVKNNRILEQRQQEYFEAEKQKQELQKQTMEQDAQQAQIMQKFIQDSFDQNSGLFNPNKFAEIQGLIGEDKYFSTLKEMQGFNTNKRNAELNTIKRQSAMLDKQKDQFEFQKRLFDDYAGALNNEVMANNPIGQQQVLSEMIEQGVGISPEDAQQFLQLQPDQKQAWLNNMINRGKSFTEQQAQALEQQKQKMEVLKERYGLAKAKAGLETEQLKQKELSGKIRKGDAEFEKDIDEKVKNTTGLLGLIQELKTHPGLKGAVGFKSPTAWGGGIGGTKAAGAIAKHDALISMLTLENMGKMKGVLSDADIKILQRAGTSLSRQMSEKEYNRELNKIKERVTQALNTTNKRYGLKSKPPIDNADPLGILGD